MIKKASAFAATVLIGVANMVAASSESAVPQLVYESLKKISPDSAIADFTYHEGIDMFYFQTDRGVDGFITADGRYIMPNKLLLVQANGSMIDESLRSSKFDVLALSDEPFIVYPAKGEVAGEVILFGDITCEYCKLVHDRIPMLNESGITVRYMAYPREGLNGSVARNMQTVWCAENPQEALNGAMSSLGDQLYIDSLAVREGCTNAAIVTGYLKGKSLKFEGTPNFLFENGTIRNGYLMSEDIVDLAKADRQQTKLVQ